MYAFLRKFFSIHESSFSLPCSPSHSHTLHLHQENCQNSFVQHCEQRFRPNANFGGGGKKVNRRKKKKKNEKKKFPPGRGPGFSLIFMKKIFPKIVKICPKRGQKKIFRAPREKVRSFRVNT